MKKLLFVVIALFLFSGVVTAKKESLKKTEVCHYDAESMTYHRISISTNALSAHLKHGDGVIGGIVPTNEDMRFGADCSYISRWQLIETIDLITSEKNGANTTSLDQGKYRFEISGEWINRGGEKVDAKYTSWDNWITYTDAPSGGYDARLLDVQINEAEVDWGLYAPDHRYTRNFEGSGVVNFRVFDGDVSTGEVIPGWYNDNVGTLTIKIYKKV